METRNILDWQGNVIGVMSLPNWTSEAVWQSKLAPYAKPPETAQEAITRRIAEFELKTKEFIEERVPQTSQMAYAMLMMMANIDGMTNRLAYLRPMWDWTQTVIGYNIQSILGVMALGTVSEVNAYSFDIDANVPPLPDVNMPTAIQIMD